jgi:hypothetical protein
MVVFGLRDFHKKEINCGFLLIPTSAAPFAAVTVAESMY